MVYSKFKSIGLNSFKKAEAQNKLVLYHELQEDEWFRQNPHLLEFKRQNYIDPDILAARRAGKTVYTNKLIKDANGFEFGRKLLKNAAGFQLLTFVSVCVFSVQAIWLGQCGDSEGRSNGDQNGM